ncbi:MAG: hypothetical protein PHN56_03520 [Candidatus Nanoarchaeia archaeon]|nr:hypothetical protein [Candidatus Nanoarchaeia archaeon]
MINKLQFLEYLDNEFYRTDNLEENLNNISNKYVNIKNSKLFEIINLKENEIYNTCNISFAKISNEDLKKYFDSIIKYDNKLKNANNLFKFYEENKCFDFDIEEKLLKIDEQLTKFEEFYEMLKKQN